MPAQSPTRGASLENFDLEILESLGYRVILAKDGADAVRVFEEKHPSIDLVFLDVVMPHLNGPEVYTQISAIKPDIPVIFTTGYASEATLLSVRSREKSAILQKPYGSQYLAQKLREILDKTTG
jgi:CheY-like chemotaxis protein